MSSISSCPQCGQQVSIPPFAAPSAQVRCPLCSGQYSLQTALENLPPMLVLVEAAEVVSDNEDIFSRPAPAKPVIAPLMSPSPVADAAASLDDIDFSVPAAQADEASASLDDIDFSSPMSTADELDDLEPDFGSDDANPRSDGSLDLSQGAFGGMSEEAADAEMELETELEDLDAESDGFQSDDVPRNEPDFAAKSKAGAVDKVAPELKTTPRKKRREPSMIGNLIGVVGGGAIGLGMGYMILLWVGGPKLDALKLGPKLPGWMLPASFSQGLAIKKPILADSGAQPQAGDTPADAVDKGNDPLPTNVPPLGGNDETPGDDPSADNSVKTAASDEDPLADPDLPGDDPLGPTTPPIAKQATKKPVAPDVDPSDDFPADDEMPADESPADPADTDTADTEPPTEPADDEMPADTDVATTTTKKPVVDPADEPTDEPTEEPTEEPAATDDVPAADEKLGPRQAPTFSLADLDQATKDVRTVVKQLADPAAAADKEAYTKLRNQFYIKFSHLGYVLTATADDPAEPRLSGHREAIQQVVLESAADDKKFSAIGRAAGKWIAMPLAKRGDNGIFLSGTVASVEPAGRLFETKLTLPGGSQVLRLLSDKEPTAAPEDRLVVLGSIVAAPSQDLVGYDGADEAVIWTGLAVVLPPKSE